MASTTAASLHNILSATSPTSPRLDVLWQQQKQTPVESQSKLQLQNHYPMNAPSFDKNVTSSTIKQRQQHEASGRIIRNILLNKDSRQNQSSRVQSEQQIQSSNLEKEKRLQRPPRGQLVLKDVNGSSDDKFVGNDLHGFSGEKQEKLTRNKDGLLFVGQMSHMQVTNPCLHLHLSLHK
ncbi:uncharacterized protein LOC107261829 isoform X2 [Ricinus communis]|uniref:uncharacterized protein LOC107261829 isoform X2 n=1 Tax=Ricinus communis TaxID=3988 RepID=UPI00201A62E4|nr:uncharacterized protein LOC107261829 isoform X2 [Ricinus communis]